VRFTKPGIFKVRYKCVCSYRLWRSGDFTWQSSDGTATITVKAATLSLLLPPPTIPLPPNLLLPPVKIAAPPPPSNVQASDDTYTDKVRVTWTASTGATGYEVWRGTTSNAESATLIGSPTSTSYDDTSADAGTTYYYRVKAKGLAGASGLGAFDVGRRKAATPSSSPPSLPTGTVKYGGYTLRLVEAIKCASVEERPYTSIVIGAVGTEQLIHQPQVLVDSGADVSMFPAWVATALGIDLSNSKEVTLGGIGGGKVVGRLAQVRIGITHLGGIETDVDGYILGRKGEPYLPTITVAFVEGGEEFILGRMDAFDLFGLDFTSDTVTIRVPSD
jgi:hypothetical protein